jgi:hypothetical protein
MRAAIGRKQPTKPLASLDTVAPPTVPMPGVASLTLYEHDNYAGRSLVITAATPNLDGNFNDLASSAVVAGDGWEVWSDANYRGQRVVLAPGSYPSLRALNMNDAISSCRPTAPPASSRKGLLITPFGSDDAQPDETMDWTNALFAAWGSDEQLAARISKAALPAILDVSDCLFTPGNPRRYLGDTLAGQRITARLDAVRAAGASANLVALYVIDEPEREAQVGAEEIAAACALCRSIAPGLALHICYGDGKDYRGVAFIDWAGVDAYGKGAGVLTDDVQALKAALRADQRLVLYPGGADPWRNDPRPFYDYAQSDPQVVAIVPFIWLAEHQGIKINGMADAYRAIGQAIIGPNAA